MTGAFVVVLLGCGPGIEPPSKLTVVVTVPPAGRDPLATFDEVSDLIVGNVFQPVLVDPLDESTARGVVEGWSNPDPLTWLLLLRKAERFHNGDPVTADDVVATIEAVLADQASPFRPFLEGVSSAVAMGRNSLRITTTTPVNLTLRLNLVPVVPGGRRFTGDALPVGSGPYRLLSWVDDQRIVLERVARSAGAPAGPPDLVELVIASDIERQREVLGADRPVIGFALGSEVGREAQQLGLRSLSVTSHATSFVVCNVRPGRPTASLDVRRAIAAAIDRRALAAAYQSAQEPAGDFFPPGVVGYRPDRYRPVTEWLRPEAIPSRALHMVAVESVSHVAETLKTMLTDAGFAVELEVVALDAGLEVLSQGEFDLSILGYMCTTGHGLELVEFAFPTVSAESGGWNFSGYSSEPLRSLIAEARTTIDTTAQRNLLAAMSDTLLHDLPWLPLLEVHRVVMVSPDVSWRPPWDGRFRLDEVVIQR